MEPTNVELHIYKVTNLDGTYFSVKSVSQNNYSTYILFDMDIKATFYSLFTRIQILHFKRANKKNSLTNAN